MDNNIQKQPLPKDYKWVEIEPVRAVISNESMSVYLGVKPNGGILDEMHQFKILTASENHEIQMEGVVDITGEDYTNWGADDNYIMEIIVNNIPGVELLKKA